MMEFINTEQESLPNNQNQMAVLGTVNAKPNPLLSDNNPVTSRTGSNLGDEPPEDNETVVPKDTPFVDITDEDSDSIEKDKDSQTS